MARSLGALGLSQDEVVSSPRRDMARTLAEAAFSARDLFTLAARGHQHEASWGRDREDSLGASEDRLEHLMSLRPNWDGYGGVPVSEETRTNVLKLLYNVLSPSDAVPSLVPGSDGAVNIEWRRPGLTLEVEVEPSGHLIAYYLDEERGDEWEGDYRDIEPRIGDLIARLSSIPSQ